MTYLRISKVVWQVFCKLLRQCLLTNALGSHQYKHWIWRLQNWQCSNHKASRLDCHNLIITDTLSCNHSMLAHKELNKYKCTMAQELHRSHRLAGSRQTLQQRAMGGRHVHHLEK